MKKDLGLALEAAISSETKLNFGELTLKKFEELVEKKQGHLDFSNIVNYV